MCIRDSADALLEGMSDSITTYSKEALLYQAVAETLDIVPTQEPVSYTHLADRPHLAAGPPALVRCTGGPGTVLCAVSLAAGEPGAHRCV